MKNLLAGIVVLAALGLIGIWGLRPEITAAENGPAKTAGNGSVAVLDLDLLAKKLNRTDAMNSDLKQRQGELNERLEKFNQQQSEKIKAEEEKVGATPTVEQTQRLNQMRLAAKINSAQELQNLRQAMALRQAEIVTRFRDEVKPHADATAKELGYLIVLVRNDQVLFTYADSVDITDAVAARMSRIAPAQSAPAQIAPAP